VTAVNAMIERHVDDVLASLTEFYLDLHQHPELSGAEVRTSAAFADWLTRAGFDVTIYIGGHGVLGVLRNGDGPTVMVRTELDGLPIEERTGLRYASTVTAVDGGGDVEPVMHACGHDAHIACAAGAGSVLARCLDQWQGTVMIVGQPAEETLAGAAAMLADGLYRHVGTPDVVLAQHVAPLPVGLVAHSTGPATAGSVALTVVVHGRGGHAATPGLAVNPIPVGAAIVGELATKSTKDLVVTVGAFRAGNRGNVIARTATLMVGLRAFDEDTLAGAVDAVSRVATYHSEAAGCPAPPDITVTSRSPVGVNDRAAAQVVRAAHERTLGADRVLRCPPSMATEDFPLFGVSGNGLHGGGAVPTVYWLTGSVARRTWAAAGPTAAARAGAVPTNHSPEFAPDPVPTVRVGTTAMVAAVLAFLRQPVTQPSTEHGGAS
jgi:hippurate hydrolase